MPLKFRVLGIIGGQVCITLAISVLLLAIDGKTAALSAFCGGAIGFLPALTYSGRVALSQRGTAQDLLRAHSAGEGFKFLTTAILFGCVFVLFKGVRAPELFLTYIATLLVYWAALLLA